ncbi:MAG: nucleoside-diphosphate kinase [Acidimicrobiales bacterium]
MMKRTLVLAKPDAVERGLVGEIVSRLERKGFTIVAADLRTADRELAEAHYAEHAERDFYSALVAYLTRSPVFAMVVAGPADNTFALVRMLVGATTVDDALPGTIRGDFATATSENLVHASDSNASASREIALWFPPDAAGSATATVAKRLRPVL